MSIAEQVKTMNTHNGYTSIHYGPLGGMIGCIYLFEGSRKLKNPRANWIGKAAVRTFKRNQLAR